MARQPKPLNEGFGLRLSAAVHEAEARALRAGTRDKLTQEEVGRRVGEILGEPPYSKQAVSGWLKGREPESFAIVEALAKVLGVTAGFLAFGPLGADVEHVSGEVHIDGPPPLEREVRPVPRPVPRPAPRSQTPRRRKSG